MAEQRTAVDNRAGQVTTVVPAALMAVAVLAAAGTGDVVGIGVSGISDVEVALTSTVVVIGGMGWETVDEPVMRQILDYRYDTPENSFVNIEWPAYLGTLGDSVAEASDSLYAHVMSTDGHQIAIGVSGSTFVTNEVMRRLAEDPDPDKPTPEDISFVIIGDGERGIIPAVVPFTGWDLPLVNYTAQPIPVTPYDAIVVKGEYDGLADWPDRPWNLLAVANALAGSPAIDHGQIHWESIWYDLDAVPAENVTTEVNAAGGTTTTYLVPTAEIPLLFPLHEMGVPETFIGMLNSMLKPVVDTGYRRNDSWLMTADPDWSRPSGKPAVPITAEAALPAPGPSQSLAATARNAAQALPADARRSVRGAAAPPPVTSPAGESATPKTPATTAASKGPRVRGSLSRAAATR